MTGPLAGIRARTYNPPAAMRFWTQWVEQPKSLWLRRALFQIHLWTGIGAGLYIVAISVTGSILVYRNELYNAATRPPIVVADGGTRLTNEQLQEAAARAHPGFRVANIFRARRPNYAVAVRLTRGSEERERLFDPFTGEDLGNSVAPGIRFVSWLTDLHDNLLFGRTGRFWNGVGAGVLVVVGLTGLVVWWPGIQSWRRSLTVRRHAGWKRFNWDFHSALGFWTIAFTLLFGITGIYLCFQQWFLALADRIQPPTDENVGLRLVDSATYWLAYLHFGRFGGQPTKFIWAVLGVMPACMFATGAVMWWTRVVSRSLRVRKKSLTLPDARPDRVEVVGAQAMPDA